MSTVDVLTAAVRRQIGPSAAWLDTARARAAGPIAELLRSYTEASRYLGRAPLDIHTAPLAGTELADVPLDRWSVEDAGRLVLLLDRYDAFPHSIDDNVAAALACLEQGDAREQESWLRTVALLPQPERFLATVIDACRTSVQPLFESVACENVYPARFFPERNFNQLVLKALFNAVALSRIVGLQQRRNPELSRMAHDYAAERRAAGRAVPQDIALAMLDAAAQGVDR